MSDHQQTAAELARAPWDRPDVLREHQDAIAAALEAAEQRGRDDLRAAVLTVIHEWEERGTPMGYYATRRLREAIGAE